MSALPAFREPDPLNPIDVLLKVLATIQSEDEATEAYGSDRLEWENSSFAALSEFRREVCIALFDPNGAEASKVRDILWKKWIRMAEDSEWSPT